MRVIGTRRRTFAAAVAVGLVGVALIAGCGGSGSDTVEQPTATAGAPEAPNPEQPLSPAETHGQDLFVQRCGSCHTFSAAGTVGQIGPNLEDIAVNEADVLHAIRTGGGRHSHGAGGKTGNMPRNLVTGQDARDVAAFVAANAGGSSTP
jgi:mono/diheme cytochrome c family protein